MDTLITFAIAAAICLVFLLNYVMKLKARERQAEEAAKKGTIYSHGPRAQHPHIDANACIGCATCTSVCPEGDVLAMLGGKAVIVNGFKCIGHSLCAEACPVGAITMVMASPGMSADLPVLSPQCETNVANLFIAGELGGLALIKNAINQGRDCVDTAASRIEALRASSGADTWDVLIVGAGWNQRVTARDRTKAPWSNDRAGWGWMYGCQVSTAETGHDQPGRAPAPREVQEAGAF